MREKRNSKTTFRFRRKKPNRKPLLSASLKIMRDLRKLTSYFEVIRSENFRCKITKNTRSSFIAGRVIVFFIAARKQIWIWTEEIDFGWIEAPTMEEDWVETVGHCRQCEWAFTHSSKQAMTTKRANEKVESHLVSVCACLSCTNVAFVTFCQIISRFQNE